MRISGEATTAIDRLRSLELFRGASDKELSRVDRLTYEVSVAPGHVLVREGDASRGFFLIVSGRAVVSVAGLEHDVLEGGMFFGEIALLDGAPEPVTVTALTPMQVRVASRREFLQLSEVQPLARVILQRLAAKQRLAYEPTPRATEPKTLIRSDP